MTKLHGKKHKTTRSKQNSEKSTKSDRSTKSDWTSESEHTKPGPTIDGYPHDTNEYQKEFIQQGTDDAYHNEPLPTVASLAMNHRGYPIQSTKPGYAPKNYTSVSSTITASQNSPESFKNPNTKPRVVIQEPIPYYKTPKTDHIVPPHVDYGKEIAETLKVRYKPNGKVI